MSDSRVSPPSVPRSSADWSRLFDEKRRSLPELPWELGVDADDPAVRDVLPSMRVFQLGESGEGRHFLKVARRHAEAVGDPEYVPALELFLAEEGRHAGDLGRYLDLAGMPRLRRNWTDGVFRRLRHLAGLEACITVLLVAEWLAFVYYDALRRATTCPLLNALCRRVLRDEVDHVRFQGQRLAVLRRRRSRRAQAVTVWLTRRFTMITANVLWLTHRPVFRHAGMTRHDVLRHARRILDWGLSLAAPITESAVTPRRAVIRLPPLEV